MTAPSANFPTGTLLALPVYLIDVGGNPLLSLLAACINAQAFSLAVPRLTSGGAIVTGVSLFNPAASGKTCYIFAVKPWCATSNSQSIQTGITADPALTTVATPVNNKGGGAASVMSATYQNTAATFSTGAIKETYTSSTANPSNMLDAGELLVLPPGQGAGVLVTTQTNAWNCTIKWFEV